MTRKPPEGKPFAKGKSGNPGGRPKTIKEVQELAREQTPAAIQALVDNLKDESGQVRNTAATELLNRAWGKAPAVQAGEGGEGPPTLRFERVIINPDKPDA